MEPNILEVRHLRASFLTGKGEIRAVNDVSLTVPPGQIVGIVGESGCGKSMTARAIMGLIRSPGRIVGGEIRLCGRDLLSLPEQERCALRGNEMSMIFQEPLTSLNPVIPVGRQVAETLLRHTTISRREAMGKVVQAFEQVGIPEPEKRCRCYPHELSGGLRQRVMIAMAMICHPRLLIADEPTTALDVTVQAQILQLMKQLKKEGTSILLISHDLGVIAQICDQVHVMYAGRIVEEADVFSLFYRPLHPYTRGLLAASSSLRRRDAALSTIPGVVPNLLHLPAGCSFSLRCASCRDRCSQQLPAWTEITPGHRVACHLFDEEIRS